MSNILSGFQQINKIIQTPQKQIFNKNRCLIQENYRGLFNYTTKILAVQDIQEVPEIPIERRQETPVQTIERRLQESQQVDDRVKLVVSEEEIQKEMEAAGNKLLVIEIMKEEVCETGLVEPEFNYKQDENKYQQGMIEKCGQIKHVFQRCARQCEDTVFLQLDADTRTGQKFCQKHDINVFPTVQFYQNKQILWQHKGQSEHQESLGKGVLYFGDSLASGEKASEYIQYVNSLISLLDLINLAQQEKKYLVVDFAYSNASGCISIFPAFLALSKQFKDKAYFARVYIDKNDELRPYTTEINIVQVPTFVFYSDGQIVDRYVGSSRAELIGHCLKGLGTSGMKIPPRKNNFKKLDRSKTRAVR